MCRLARGLRRLGVAPGDQGEFLRHQTDNAGAAVVLAESDYAARVAEVAAQLPALRCDAPDAPGMAQCLLPWHEALVDGDDDPGVDVQPRDLAMLIYTGGTTGLSKSHLHRNQWSEETGQFSRGGAVRAKPALTDSCRAPARPASS